MDFNGYNGTIAVNGDQLTITHSGFAARTGGLVRDQPREIPLRAISGVNFKEATRLVNGWLTLGLGGAEPVRLSGGTAPSDANTVMFRHQQKDDFEKLRDLLLSVIEKNQEAGVDPSTVAFDGPQQTRLERMQDKKEKSADGVQQARLERMQDKKEKSADGPQQTRLERMHDKMEKFAEGAGLARGFGITLYSDRIEKGQGKHAESHPLVGVSAQVESAEELHRRITVTRLALTGVFAFALRKKAGGTSFLTVEGPGFAWVEEVDRKQKQQAVVFAAKVRAAATSLPKDDPADSQPIEPQAADVTDQLRKLGELHAAGILTDAEFSAKKTELLGRL
jgi:Short C-terminal domain/Domain of unknown function (DUF4429)